MTYTLTLSKVAHKNILKPKYAHPLYDRFMFKLHFYHQFYQFYLCFVGKKNNKLTRITKIFEKFTFIRYDLIANQIKTHSVVHSNEQIYTKKTSTLNGGINGNRFG